MTPARLAAACLLMLALAAFWPALRADFALIDDHEYLATLPVVQAHPQAVPAPSFWATVLTVDPARGRLRPFHWVVRVAEVRLIGVHAGALHTFTLALGVASALMLYAALRALGVGALPAALAGATTLVAPGAATIWIRLGLQETVGTACLTLALLAAARRPRASCPGACDALFVVATLAAALTKESFILAIPALAAARWLAAWLAGTERPARLWWDWPTVVLAGAGAALLALTVVVAWRAGAGSDGGRYVDLPWTVFARNVWANARRLDATVGSLLLPALGTLVAVVLKRSRRLLLGWLVVAGSVALLVGPQVALYSRAGAMQGRYLFPAVVGVAAGMAGVVSWLGARGWRLAVALVVVVWAAWLTFGATAAWASADAFRANTVALRAMTDGIAATVPLGGTVGIAADPVLDYEQSASLLTHLGRTGRADMPIRLLPVAPLGAYQPEQVSYLDIDALGQSLHDGLFANHYGLPAGTCDTLAVVIILEPLDRVRAAYPCLGARYTPMDYTAHWGAGGTATYSVLIRHP